MTPPDVWIGDDVPDERAHEWFYWKLLGDERVAMPKRGEELVGLEYGEVRSVEPIKSPERAAALEECAKLLNEMRDALAAVQGFRKLNFKNDKASMRITFMECVNLDNALKDSSAAISRLEACR